MASPSGAAGAAPATPPLPPASPPPPSTDSPPPAVSSPPASQPGVPPTSLSPPTVPGSPPPASPPPTVTPVPSSTPPISPPPTASPPLVASPPPPFQAPPPASPPEASPPPPSAAPPPDSPPPPPLPAPSPTTVVPSPPVASPPPVVAPPPTPAESSAPTPPASLPPASPPPPSTAPPTTSPQPPSPTPSRPTVAPSPPGGLTPPPVASPPPTVGLPPPVASPPPTPARAAGPTPSRPAPPPAEHSPSPPPVAGLPSPPDSQTPAIPSPSPPARNETQPSPSVSPPGKSPSPSRSPPSNPTPSGPPSPSPVSNSSHPRVPIIPAPPGPNISRTSNSAPGASLPEDVSPSEGGGIKIGTAIGIAVVVSLVVLGLLGIVLWSVKKRKRKAGGFAGGHVMPSPFNSSRMSDSPRSPTPLVKNRSASHGFQYSSDPGLGHSRPWFTYEELSEITNGFSSQNLLGEGGFGCVYKGQLPDGREVAVKQLKVDGGQGDREFRAEVEIISRVHHRHLVSLVGFCISENQKILIYDYVPNNTLHYHLHGEGRPVMDWATRLKVALGAARGLAYLHEDCHPRIIHRDIKSSNILLDNNYEARVSDFGLAKLAVDANTHVTTRVVGTFGYLAPEYASSGKLTSKSDVFSFGVVLLELVTGRKPVDPSQPVGDESLVEWARPLMTHALETGEFEVLPDPRLEKNYNQSEMFRMIEVAAACVRHSAAMRPHMGQVVRALDGLGHSTDLHNGMTPGQSELFNSAQQSEEIRLFQRMAFGSQNFSSDFSQTSWSKKL